MWLILKKSDEKLMCKRPPPHPAPVSFQHTENRLVGILETARAKPLKHAKDSERRGSDDPHHTTQAPTPAAVTESPGSLTDKHHIWTLHASS